MSGVKVCLREWNTTFYVVFYYELQGGGQGGWRPYKAQNPGFAWLGSGNKSALVKVREKIIAADFFSIKTDHYLSLH